MKTLRIAATAALFLALVVPASAAPHEPPPWNDPDEYYDCSNQFEHDNPAGADVLFFQSYPGGSGGVGWVPYLVINGTDDPVYDDCGQWSSYTSAGEIGDRAHVTLRSNARRPLNDGAAGLVWWTTDHTAEPYYSPFGGWSMLGGQIVATWTFKAAEKLYAAQGWIGWRRYVTWPDDPDLVGARLFVQGYMVDGPEPPTGGDEFVQVANLSGTWYLIFSDEN